MGILLITYYLVVILLIIAPFIFWSFVNTFGGSNDMLNEYKWKIIIVILVITWLLAILLIGLGIFVLFGPAV